MKRILFYFVLTIAIVACSKDYDYSYSYSVVTEDVQSTDSTCVLELGMDDAYWISRGITLDSLRMIDGGLNKMQACQIPEKQLKKMSSEKLARVCLSYPLGFDYLLANDELEAVSFMIDNFNGLDELCKRADGPLELIKAYASIQRNDVYTQLKEAFAENILACDKVYKNLNDQTLEMLRDVVNVKIADRSKSRKTLIPQDRINNLHSRLTGYTLFSNLSSELTRDFEARLILTPFGKVVDYIIHSEFSQDSINFYTQKYVNSVYDVEMLAPASRIYNCHAYAWASVRDLWINDPRHKYANNDLYFQSDDNVAIVYYCGDHSAVKGIGSSSNEYISKWSKGPLVRHSLTNVPASYQPNNRINYSLPYIRGNDMLEQSDEIYTYTMYPYMGYATYSWELPDQRETHYEIINVTQNSLQIKFKLRGIYDIYCYISNAAGEIVHSDMIEVLVE